MTESARTGSVEFDIDALDFAKGGGLVTVVTQDSSTGAVLMVAHADRQALELCRQTGEMHYRSRSRGLWRKGDTSGNVQHIVSLASDCDGDAVLARVRVAGPACHSGSTSCFGAAATDAHTLSALDAVIERRATEASDDASYTIRLLRDRNLRLKKIGEESAELVAALADGDAPRTAEEAADVVYHTLVAARAVGVRLADVVGVLEARAR